MEVETNGTEGKGGENKRKRQRDKTKEYLKPLSPCLSASCRGQMIRREMAERGTGLEAYIIHREIARSGSPQTVW